MTLAVVLATAGAIAYEARGIHAASVTRLLADFSDHLAIRDVEVMALWAALIGLRSGERMLVRVFRGSLPGAQEMTASIALVVLCTWQAAPEDTNQHPFS